jgi:hypothetical protein
MGWLRHFRDTFDNIVLCDASCNENKTRKTRKETKRKTFLYLIINLK